MRDIQLPGRSATMSTNGMVATSQPLATEAGLNILRQGGNAMDAAIAACAVQCVIEPQSTGIGGDCFVLYHYAKSGKLFGLNGSGRAPARATLEEYQRRGQKSVPARGILSVSVPGALDAWETALQRFGTMEWDAVLQPAIDLAERGFPVTPVVSIFWKNHRELLAASTEARKTLLVAGDTPVPGSLFKMPELGASLRTIAREGSRAFYTGQIAREITRFSQENDGLLEMEDLAAHRSEWVEPVGIDYGGLTLYEIPPNGVGITALMALNILENLPIGRMDHLSVEYIHTLSEAYKLAVAERDRYISDMAFNQLPLDSLLAKDFGKRQAGRIDPGAAGVYPLASGLPDHHDTVYLSVVDKDRNAVSFINSLYMGFGSGLVAGDTGIVLQNRGAGFVLEEGHFNCIAPGKRPLHTIIPAMAYRDGRPVLSFGVMGGFYQPMGHVYVLTNWLDYGMNLQEAIDAPRFVPEKGALLVEREIPEDTRNALANLGHRVEVAELTTWGAQAVYLDWESGVLHGGSDPRKDGCALGY